MRPLRAARIAAKRSGSVMNRILWTFLLIAALAAPAFAQAEVEQRKIEYLIRTVAELHDARFVRNGSEYGAEQAADHLRQKLRYAGSRVKTAENFIDYCATSSSFTGLQYSIKFADGRVVPSADFLREKLAAFPARQPVMHPPAH
jgi:hypothetical protein